MKRVVFVFWVMFVVCIDVDAFDAGDIWSRSPDGGFVILRNNEDPVFWDLKSNSSVGSILRKSEKGEISNLQVVASWSPDGRKVAVLLYYGTRLSDLRIFQKNKDGRFRELKISLPNQVEYKAGEGAPGFDENAVGPWTDNRTVALLLGNCKEFESGSQHFFVAFTFTVDGGAGVVEVKKRMGPLDDRASSEFLNAWGNIYW